MSIWWYTKRSDYTPVALAYIYIYIYIASKHKTQEYVTHKTITTETVVGTRSAIVWDFTQRILVVCYRRFGTTYRYRLLRVKD